VVAVTSLLPKWQLLLDLSPGSSSFHFEPRISYRELPPGFTRRGPSGCLLDRANDDFASRGLACGLADVGGVTVQATSKITAYLCGVGAAVAGEETVWVGGGRQARGRVWLLVVPNMRGPAIGGPRWGPLLPGRKDARGGRRWRSAACSSSCLVRRPQI